MITAIRAGRAITVAPLAQRLTTLEAADLLDISRPTMIKLLDDGKLPFGQPSRHRRTTGMCLRPCAGDERESRHA
ncbi:excisionase family DNA-binding protein [Actinophytocola sp.]|uniref:excisionase family DNA-binding protein n=1 Tax=Actinophytocola sp. TaxID=1872138 RepID=UPI002ED4C030